MARLTKDQWAAAKKKWENDPREGYAWLADEIGVSRPAVSKKADNDFWKKTAKVSIQKVTQKLRKKAIPNDSVGKEKQPDQEPQQDGESNPVGRPTLYKPEYAELAEAFCLMGATDATLAEQFDVTEQTINNWKIEHPEFFESIKNGKDVADAKVASALFKSATGGHVITEDKLVDDGTGNKEVITLEKQIEPSVAAQRYWLNNRQRENWKDKVEAEVKVDVRLIPWDELRLITEKSLAIAEEKHKSLIEGRAERLGLKIEYTSDAMDIDG